MAAFRNLAIGVLKAAGATDIAKTTRAISAEPQRAMPFLGITHQPEPRELEHAPARQAIIRYIEGFYNRRRLHSGLGYRTPQEAENRYWELQLAA